MAMNAPIPNFQEPVLVLPVVVLHLVVSPVVEFMALHVVLVSATQIFMVPSKTAQPSLITMLLIRQTSKGDSAPLVRTALGPIVARVVEAAAHQLTNNRHARLQQPNRFANHSTDV